MLYKLVKKIYQWIFNLYYKINRIYWSWRARLACHSYKTPPNVAFKSNFTKSTFFGRNVNFNGMSIAGQGKVIFGDNFHSGRACKIITSFHNFDSGTKIPYDESYIHKDVIIEDNVWIGDNVIILGGVTISEGAIIQAGSVVAKDIPKCAIAGGHPATPFKYRNVEHYEKLKREKRFL